MNIHFSLNSSYIRTFVLFALPLIILEGIIPKSLAQINSAYSGPAIATPADIQAGAYDIYRQNPGSYGAPFYRRDTNNYNAPTPTNGVYRRPPRRHVARSPEASVVTQSRLSTEDVAAQVRDCRYIRLSRSEFSECYRIGIAMDDRGDYANAARVFLGLCNPSSPTTCSNAIVALISHQDEPLNSVLTPQQNDYLINRVSHDCRRLVAYRNIRAMSCQVLANAHVVGFGSLLASQSMATHYARRVCQILGFQYDQSFAYAFQLGCPGNHP